MRGLRVRVPIAIAMGVLAPTLWAQQLPVHVESPEVWHHRIGIEPLLRGASESSTTIDVETTVDADGKVIAAHAIPAKGWPVEERLLDAAVAAELASRYRPFKRHGLTVPVEFTDYVELHSPERPPWRHEAFPAITNPNNVVIRLERGGLCLGRCPQYVVEIRGDGAVSYEGKGLVAVPGRHSAHMAPEVAYKLIEAFRKADYFSLSNEYGPSCCDAEMVTLKITVGGRSHFVRDYMGLDFGMPTGVYRLEKQVDMDADSQRWAYGTEATIPSLRAEGWDFTSDESADMLVDFASDGNLQLIPALLAAGVNPARAGDALSWAAWHGDSEAVTALLSAGAKGGRLDSALVEMAQTGNVALMKTLIQAGANPHAYDLLNGNMLIQAAASGNPDAVRLALDSHIDVNQSNMRDRTALNTAAWYASYEKEHGNRGDYPAIVRLLLSHGATPTWRTNRAIPRYSSAPGIRRSL